MTDSTPTNRQIGYAKWLAKEAGYRDVDEALCDLMPWTAGPGDVRFEDLTRSQMSRLIERLKPLGQPEVELVIVPTGPLDE